MIWRVRGHVVDNVGPGGRRTERWRGILSSRREFRRGSEDVSSNFKWIRPGPKTAMGSMRKTGTPRSVKERKRKACRMWLSDGPRVRLGRDAVCTRRPLLSILSVFPNRYFSTRKIFIFFLARRKRSIVAYASLYRSAGYGQTRKRPVGVSDLLVPRNNTLHSALKRRLFLFYLTFKYSLAITVITICPWFDFHASNYLRKIVFSKKMKFSIM